MEKVAFVMPEDHEMFLAAMSAVQAWDAEMQFQMLNADKYLADIEQQNRQALREGKITQGQMIMICQTVDATRQMQCVDRQHELTIVLKDSSFDSFTPVFGKSQFLYGDFKAKRGEWDLVHRFDPQRAYKIAAVTERHAASAFGLIIGSEASSLPDLSQLGLENQPAKHTIDVLFAGRWPDRMQVVQFLADTHKGKWFELTDNTGLELLEKVYGADMVVGPRSAATYLAAIYGKRVVELYPDDRHKRWLSKWDSKNYRMVYGSEYPAALVWKAMEGLWARPSLVRSHTDHALIIRTGLRTSAAGLAAVSLRELEDKQLPR